jgi:hypothetical protein
MVSYKQRKLLIFYFINREVSMQEAQFLNRSITLHSDPVAVFADRAPGFHTLLQTDRHAPPQIGISTYKGVGITPSRTRGADYTVRMPIYRASDLLVPYSHPIRTADMDILSYARPISIQNKSIDRDAFLSGGDQKKDGERPKPDKPKPDKPKPGKGGGREPQEPQEPKTRKVGY